MNQLILPAWKIIVEDVLDVSQPGDRITVQANVLIPQPVSRDLETHLLPATMAVSGVFPLDFGFLAEADRRSFALPGHLVSAHLI